MVKSNYFKPLNGLNCAEYLVGGVVNSYNRDFQLMFLRSWGFDINFNKQINDYGFISDNVENEIQLLELFHGIHIEYYHIQNYEDFKYLVCSELNQGMPVMASVNLYWVPWALQNYLMSDWGHTVLIDGVTEDGWICFDNFSTQRNLMPHDHMKKCFDDICVFRMLDEPVLSLEACLTEIKSGIQSNLLKTNAFEKMNALADFLSDTEMICRILMDKAQSLTDFQTTSFMLMLNRISQRRSQFAHSLRYLSLKFDNCKEFAVFAQQLDQIAASWKSIWGMLQKAYQLPNNEALLKRIPIRFIELSLMEKNACNSLLNYINYGVIMPQDPHTSIAHNISYSTCICIDGVANHKSVGSTTMPITASFQNGFIIADSVLNKGNIITNSVSFKLCPLSQSFDNISCLGQYVPIEAESIAISILCCSEFSHQIEEIIIIGDTEKCSIPFYVTSWTWQNSEFQQEIAWKGFEGVFRENGIKAYPLPRHIFYKTYFLPKRMQVKSIKLPYCPNIHIFGITIHN